MNTAPLTATLLDNSHYFTWRAQKLAQYPTNPTNLMVEITNPNQLTDAERDTLQ
jgi:hypothetical protein